MTSKNENDEASRALQEDGVPRLFRSRHINPQRGLHDKPGKLRQTLTFNCRGTVAARLGVGSAYAIRYRNRR